VGKKKYQIFISSTYLDLQDERQAAVEAILGSKHIPAGMELFRAGNASQLDTIKKWIDESDIYMLILGGRYGSIEPKTGKSYTQLEYEYALEKKIPVFAVVLSNSFLYIKATDGKYEVFEKENIDKYGEFKKFVMSKVIKPVDDCKDIQIAIKDSIVELEDECKLVGWVKASEAISETILRSVETLTEENINLKEENEKLKNLLNNKMKIENIAQGDDEIEIRYIIKTDYNSSWNSRKIMISWDNLFSAIGPDFIAAKNIENSKSLISHDLERYAEKKYYDIQINEDDFNTIKIQFDALNLINCFTAKSTNSGIIEFMQITEQGKVKLKSLRVLRKNYNKQECVVSGAVDKNE